MLSFPIIRIPEIRNLSRKDGDEGSGKKDVRCEMGWRIGRGGGNSVSDREKGIRWDMYFSDCPGADFIWTTSEIIL